MENPKGEVSRILKFLDFNTDVENLDYSKKLSHNPNNNFIINSNTFEKLKRIFNEHNKDLENNTGFNFFN